MLDALVSRRRRRRRRRRLRPLLLLFVLAVDRVARLVEANLVDLGDVDADVARLQTPGVDFAEEFLARQVIVLDRESEAQLVLSRNAQELLLIHKILPEGEKLR